MDKTLKLLPVLFLIYWGCEDLFDPSVNLWGEDYSIKNTTRLDLFGLTGTIPPRIGDLTNLEYLELSGDLIGGIPSEIGNLTNLTNLHLNHNQLTGEIPSEIGNLTNLTHLFLNYNELTGEIPLELGNLTNLKYLRLNDNQLTGEISESICNLNIIWNISWYGYLEPASLILNNQFCPPYPSCIEDNVGEQDTSDCD